MTIWIIRGKYNYEVMREYYEEFPYRKTNDFEDGQWLYWSRTSSWVNKDKVSIQVNKPSASRAFKRAKDIMEDSFRTYITDIELLEMDIKLPNGE